MSTTSHLRAGATMTDITSPLDISLAGSFRASYVDKVFEPLRANAVF